MNTFKNLVFLAVLAAAAFGVYVSLNRPPEQPLPPGLTATTTAPMVEIPGMSGNSPLTSASYGSAENGALTGYSSSSPPSSPPMMAATPPSSATSTPGGEAPPFSPPPSVALQPPTASLGGTAPPFAGPSITPPGPSITSSGATGSAPRATDPFSVPSSAPFVSNPSSSPSASATVLAATPLPPDRSGRADIESIMQQVDAKVAESAAQHDDKKLADALLVLSQVYGSPDVPAEKSREVIQVLDQMAGMVIYSRKHTLESPYLVQSGDTMDRIAERYQVPSQLLTRINGIRDPQNMPPGKELKVIQGPFSAQISTDRSEMTIMLKGRYAGRFPVALNSDLGSSGGIFTVREKRMQAPPVASAAVPVTSKPWIDLGNQISIQGTSDSRTAGSSHGTIWLSDQDMDDVYGILSVGSNVVIQR